MGESGPSQKGMRIYQILAQPITWLQLIAPFLALLSSFHLRCVTFFLDFLGESCLFQTHQHHHTHTPNAFILTNSFRPQVESTRIVLLNHVWNHAAHH
jgi:hypothetical protein